MTEQVSDSRSNDREQIEYAARKIGKSKIRRAVFYAICYGKQRRKNISEIVKITGFPRKQVLWEAKKLANWRILDQVESGQDPVYEKDPFICQHTKEILTNAKDAKKRDKIATKRNPRSSPSTSVRISLPKIPRKFVNTKQISINDIDSFSKVKKFGSMPYIFRDESEIKSKFKKILGERGNFPDWGGEPNDLFTTLQIGGKRYTVAFAFKGKSKKKVKKLTWTDMGKNGDQILRMFRSPAKVFFVQFVGQIDENVPSLMEQLSIARSYTTGDKIFYGIIDGSDTSRIFSAYN
jgi:hypothetical protein